ncbi:MAG TPA: FlgD immunoglobulin-like domain containing protein, partial [Candidatus Krumholzibacteria bacterium]|nr:FlgD immunoglobulin-like domain containing protein [Candidatus Krumholzibacteria bacterium]
ELMGVDNQTYGAQLSGVMGRTIKGSVQKLFHNRLEQNFPNPFNPQTTIAFSIQKASNVHLSIYDVTGSRVRDLVDEKRVPGAYRVVWDGLNQKGNSVASGVYFYKLTAGEFTSAKKMVLLK